MTEKTKKIIVREGLVNNRQRGSAMKQLIILIICCCVFISGCGVVRGAITKNTRSRLDGLQIGMTPDQVKAIMGKPYKREAYQGVEYWLYQTESAPDIFGDDYKIEDSDFTPVAFVNGKVDGWGRNYYQERKSRIDADINIKK